jgi:tetratricopeptide (TPR) repeat protein
LLNELQAIYDGHRYLDAWYATSSRWHPSTDINQLSVDELILAGRLALRLGGPRLARTLFRTARRLAPVEPRVRYFTEYLHVPRVLLLDELTAFEASPDLGGDDLEVRTSWIALYAVMWARLRNMPRALGLIREAHTLLPNDSWLYSREADIWGIGDDWKASLRAAEQAWSLDPRSPWAAMSVGTALLNIGQLEEALGRVTAAAADTQSAELIQAACWYECAWADLMEGEERLQSVTRARALAARLEPLSPLADREFKAAVARIWLDIATLADDRGEIERWAQEARSPFHRRVLAHLKLNPNGRRIRLPYRRALQKHNECVPTSVSSALSASNIDVSIADFASDVTYGGTSEWAAADWLRARNLHVRFFSATAETTWQLLKAGIGFIVTWPDDDGGHAVAIVGMDQAAGVVLAHDPTSLRTSEYLLQVFDQSRSPYGVLGMAAVRVEQRSELDSLLPPDAAIVEAAQAQQKALMLYGPSAARGVLGDVLSQFPDHPGAREMLATQDSDEGRIGQALTSFLALRREFPQAPRLRSKLISASRALSNTALLRDTLRSIVETGSVPGLQPETEWIRPHPRYVTEYADLLRLSTATRHEAEVLLRSVLRVNWSAASAWHVLADLRWDERRISEALLAFSIASFLAPHNEHYARAYVDVLLHEGRAQEGLAWLEDRARRLGRALQGVSAWTTWISTLEDWGYPERALVAYEQAAEQHGSSIDLLSFAVQFLARMARWEEARVRLEALSTTEGRASFHEAAVAFHQMRGEPHVALEHASKWVSELPRSMAARYAVLKLLSTLEGNGVAVVRAEDWMREHPANEDFEEAFCHYAQDGLQWRKLRILKIRLRRNAEDGWAWRELIFGALALYDRADSHRRHRMTPRIEAWLTDAERVSRDHAAFLRAQALWQENRGDWRAAVDGYVEAIHREPESFFAYRRAWECAARQTDAERRELWAGLESRYLNSAVRLPNASEMVGLLARRFGVPETETIVERWQAHRPDDPNVLEAAADLLLNHGHGRSSKERALHLLEAAAQRFPAHAGLHFSLAGALRAVGNYAQAKTVFLELVERQPSDGSALISLAWIEHREGNTALALETLERARRLTPLDPRPLNEIAQVLIDAGRYADAQAAVEQMMRTIPNSVQTYEWAIARFRQCGQPAAAVEAARKGTQAFPKGAYLWLLLARTLREDPQFVGAGEVEACLRRSLKHNATLYESADWLAVHLVEQHRYDEAAGLLHEVESHMPDPSAARGRLAWIKRERGETAAAVTDLADVVSLAPWYTWGWNILLGWLGEDKDWTRTKKLLSTIPPPMLGDLEFRRKRLELLERSGADKSVIESEWNALLNDSPEDIVLHLRRFDALQKARRPSEAAEVLRRVMPSAEDNVYLRARMVDVHCFERTSDAALQDALMVCFARIEESEWPANHVWESIRNAGYLGEFATRFRSRLNRGEEPTARSLSLYAEDLVNHITEGKLPNWIRRSWLNPAVFRLHTFVRVVEHSSWAQPAHIARLMEALNKGGHRRMVLACWRHLKDRKQDADTSAWAQAGNALVNLRRKRAARALLADWRMRTGVQMWMLANYLISLPRLTTAMRNEVVATCSDGLATLTHDHCARYLVYMGAEACVLSRDRDGLLAIWETYARYFEDSPKKDEFFPMWQRYLIADIPVAVRLFSKPTGKGYKRLLFKLHTKRLWNPSTRARLRSILIFLFRLVLIASLSGGALMQLFR